MAIKISTIFLFAFLYFSSAPPKIIIKLLFFALLEVRLAIYSLCVRVCLPFFLFLRVFSVDLSVFLCVLLFPIQLTKQTNKQFEIFQDQCKSPFVCFLFLSLDEKYLIGIVIIIDCVYLVHAQLFAARVFISFFLKKRTEKIKNNPKLVCIRSDGTTICSKSLSFPIFS